MRLLDTRRRFVDEGKKGVLPKKHPLEFAATATLLLLLLLLLALGMIGAGI